MVSKGFLLLLFIVVIAGSAYSQEEQKDFRKTTWGMSIKEVEELEKDSLSLKSESELVYLTKIDGQSAELKFHFNQKLLTDGLYFISIEDSTNLTYLEFYSKLKSYLSHKYGESSENNFNLSDSEESKKSAIDSVSIGKKSFSTVFNSERTRIALKMNGFSNNVYLFLMYMAKSHVLDLMPKYDEKLLDEL